MAKECMLSTGKLPLGGLLRNSVVRTNDHPNMTSAVDLGHKSNEQTQNASMTSNTYFPIFPIVPVP